MINLENMAKAIKYFCTVTEKKDMPLYWLAFFLLVAKNAEHGITTKEASEEIGMTQGIASRTVKLMSLYRNPETNQREGLGLLIPLQNDETFRARQKVYLTDKGREIAAKLQEIMK